MGKLVMSIRGLILSCLVRFLDVRQSRFVQEWKVTTSSVAGTWADAVLHQTSFISICLHNLLKLPFSIQDCSKLGKGNNLEELKSLPTSVIITLLLFRVNYPSPK